MALSDDQMENLCLVGSGRFCCSFLVMGSNGFQCAKSTEFESVIRVRRARGTITAMGDNCSGPPDFNPTILEEDSH